VREIPPVEGENAHGGYDRTPVSTRSPPSLDDALRVMSAIEGWLTDEQAKVLFDAARALEPGARIVEVGSHYGRSTVVLALGAADGVEIVAVDPFLRPERAPGDERTDEEVGDDDFARFESNLAAAGVRDRIRLLRLLSAGAAEVETGPVDLLFVDGDHSFAGAHFDIETWGGRVRPGGTLLVHDAYSSVGVTLVQIMTLFAGARFRYIRRVRSLAAYRREELAPQERLANALRQTASLPWFARNVAVKMALRTGVMPIVRVLRHEGVDDPY
jgi:predicted O-methyltransferase YrrM